MKLLAPVRGSPAVFGAGHKERTFAATESMRLAGRVERVRKVTLQLFGRRDGEELCQASAFSQPLIAEKPETFITPLIKPGDGDRPACSPAELIEGVVRLGPAGAVIEPVVGVERVIAEELIEAAVKLVAAGLHDDVNYAAACAPELGR